MKRKIIILASLFVLVSVVQFTTFTGFRVSLRQAILDANANPGADTINFNIPTTDPGYNGTTGAFTIHATSSPLPPITDTLTINGYSQPGASQNTLSNGDNAVLKVEIKGDQGAFKRLPYS